MFTLPTFIPTPMQANPYSWHRVASTLFIGECFARGFLVFVASISHTGDSQGHEQDFDVLPTPIAARCLLPLLCVEHASANTAAGPPIPLVKLFGALDLTSSRQDQAFMATAALKAEPFACRFSGLCGMELLRRPCRCCCW